MLMQRLNILWTRGKHKENKDWSKFGVIVYIKTPDKEWAKKLTQWAFDRSMSFEDKMLHFESQIVPMKIVELND